MNATNGSAKRVVRTSKAYLIPLSKKGNPSCIFLSILLYGIERYCTSIMCRKDPRAMYMDHSLFILPSFPTSEPDELKQENKTAAWGVEIK